MDKLPERIRIKDIARLAEVSVGTVDRVLHGRPGVSKNSRERVEKILKELDYHPNMYASALASNKKYNFVCMLPLHSTRSYWHDIEQGARKAELSYSDFHISVEMLHYDPYDFSSFESVGKKALDMNPDGVMFSPTMSRTTLVFTKELEERKIPYVFVDSQVKEASPLAFFGQQAMQSGYFAGRMLMLLAHEKEAVVVFRHSRGGQMGSNQQHEREIGFRYYMNEHHKTCKIWELDVDVRQNQEETIQLLDDFFTSHPEVKLGITFNSQVHVFGEYLEYRNKSKAFNLLGYDLLDRNVNCLRKGTVTFLIAQQPFFQGYNGIQTLCKSLILRKDVKQVNYMPIDLLSAENLDYYLDSQESE